MARSRRRKEPHLWRHANGVLYILWQEDGKTRMRSTGAARMDEAMAALRTFRADLERPHWGRSGELTLVEAAREWLAEKSKRRHGLTPSTLRQYRLLVDRLAAFVPAGLPATGVSPRDLRRFLDHLEREFGLTPQGLRKRMGLLSMLFAWLVDEGVVGRNPVRAIQAPRADSTPTPELAERDYLELQGDVAEAIAAADRPDTRRGLEVLQDLLEVLWCSGMRRIDALRLRWEDIDLDQAVWTIRAPANKGGHVVLPIHRRLVPLLQRRRLLGGEGPFPGVQAFQSIWRRFKAARPRWAGTSLHSLRTAFITRLRRAGHHEEAKRLARHRSAAMSDLYFRDRPEDWRGVLDRM